MERVAVLVGLVLVRMLVAHSGALDLVTAGAVLQELAVEVSEGLLPDGADGAWCELEPAFPLLDETGLLEQPRELAQTVEGARRVVAEELARALDVDLRQLAGLRRRAEEVLEVVEITEGVEQPGHLAELQRLIAREALRPLPGQVRERLLQVARQRVDLPAQVEVVEE